MRNFIIVICVFVLGLGMSACKSKGVTSKNETANLVEKKWKLIEINGVALTSMNPQPAIEAFIMFQANENRVSGVSGCNNFTGTYKAGPGTTLQFSGVASTRKMCLDMTVEDQMNKLFQTVDSYTVQDGTLSFKQGGAVLAKFVVSD